MTTVNCERTRQSWTAFGPRTTFVLRRFGPFSSSINRALRRRRSDVTLEIGTLTGPVTINAQSGTPWDGQEADFREAQDPKGQCGKMKLIRHGAARGREARSDLGYCEVTTPVRLRRNGLA